MIFHRNNDRFSTVLPKWRGATAAVLGGGDSLTQAQVDEVFKFDVRCVAVNDAYLLAPYADVLYAADPRWWRWHLDGIAKPLLGLTAAQVRARIMSFSGEWGSIQSDRMGELDWSINVLRNRDHPCHGFGLSLEPDALVTGHNGGFQAMNLTVLAGASTVLLLGFDGRAGVDGRSHFHGGHPRPTPPAAYEQYRKAFSAAEAALALAHVRVINCSIKSAIDSFEKMEVGHALEATARRLRAG